MTQPASYAPRFDSTIARYKDTYPGVDVEFVSVAGLDHEEIYAKILCHSDDLGSDAKGDEQGQSRMQAQ